MIGHLLNREAYVYYPRQTEDAAGATVLVDEAAGRKIRVRVRTASRREVRDASERYEISHVIYAKSGHGLIPGNSLDISGVKYRIQGERPVSIPTHHAEIDALRHEEKID